MDELFVFSKNELKELLEAISRIPGVTWQIITSPESKKSLIQTTGIFHGIKMPIMSLTEHNTRTGVDIIRSVLVANTEGYRFNCLGNKADKYMEKFNGCVECKQMNLDFVTADVEAAVKHSQNNNVPFWFDKIDPKKIGE